MSTSSELYAERRDRFGALAVASAARADRISQGRLATFLLACGGLALRFWGPPGLALWGDALGVLGLLGYAALALVHGRVLSATAHLQALQRRNLQAMGRVARDFTVLPPCPDLPPFAAGAPGPQPSLAADLDLVGPASLLRLLSTASTSFGQRTLGRWLLEGAAVSEVRARQAAVAELVPMLDLRDELGARAEGLAAGPAGPGWDADGFAAWAEGPRYLATRGWLRTVGPIASAGAVVLGGLDLFGVWLQNWWLLGALANAAIVWSTGATVQAIFERVSARQEALTAVAKLLALLQGSRLQSPRLSALQARLAGAEREVAALGRLVGWTEVRRTPLLHLPLQLFLLWDLHWLARLEAWQARVGPRGRGWLEALGEAEALASLAALAHAEPGWAVPQLDEDPAAPLQARALGHPLIAAGPRIDNDLAVGPAGSFVLLTGSNMSGKSTLLRALGLNVLLAQAGGVVCAQALSLPRLTVLASLRVQDSLEAGLSRFLAELQRLREVVEAARASAAAGSAAPRVLYLLDEVLAGTNAPERRAAVPIVLRQLLQAQAIGVLTTHDPEIVEAADLLAAGRPFHLTDTVVRSDGQVTIAFDHRLKPGLAPAGNALAFLEAVGLSRPA